MSASFTPLSHPLAVSSPILTPTQPCSLLPFPTAFTSFPAFTTTAAPRSQPRIETLPARQNSSSFAPSRAAPLAALPATPRPPIAVSPFPEPSSHKHQPITICHSPESKTAVADSPSDFTDDDLREAFGPIVEEALRKAVYAKENGMDTYLEPMLRATIRRALAEYSPASRPFQAPATYHRFIWHLQALFTSRTYEEILFKKTHRFQMDEVFLLDIASLALVSFASCDPARHASAKRVNSTVQRIALQLRDIDGKTRNTFETSDKRTAIARQGRFVCLVAIVRGRSNELILADLDFALRRIEERFRTQFLEQGSALLHPLQPYLEDCLLIQAPASTL